MFFRDSRIRLITHENKGFVSALRAAIEASRGSLIAIHGSGDISLPDRIEMQANLLMKSPDVGVVGCYMRGFNVVTGKYHVKRPVIEEDQLSQLIKENIFSHGEVMFKRIFYEQVGGYRVFFEFAQDRDLWLRLAPITRFAIVPKILYERELIEGSVTRVPSKARKQAYLSEFAVTCALIKREQGFDPLDRDGYEAFQKLALVSLQLPLRLRSLAFRYLASSKLDAANTLMAEAVFLDPSIHNRSALVVIVLAQRMPIIRVFLKLIIRWRSNLIWFLDAINSTKILVND